jgi:hypothetical protein
MTYIRETLLPGLGLCLAIFGPLTIWIKIKHLYWSRKAHEFVEDYREYLDKELNADFYRKKQKNSKGDIPSEHFSFDASYVDCVKWASHFSAVSETFWYQLKKKIESNRFLDKQYVFQLMYKELNSKRLGNFSNHRQDPLGQEFEKNALKRDLQRLVIFDETGTHEQKDFND